MSDPQQPPHPQHQVPPHVSQQPPFPPGATHQHAPGQQPPEQHAPQQQPQYRQPQYQQPPAPQEPQGYAPNGQNAVPGPSTPTRGNVLGRAGLIVGLVGIVLSMVTSLVVQVLIRTDGYMIISVVSSLGSLLSFAAALAALILGLIGLRRRGAPLVAAGIATGIGIAGVVGIAFNFLVSAVSSALYL